MTYIPLYSVMLVRDGRRQVPSQYISNPADVYNFLREPLEHADREIFQVLFLNQRNGLIGLHTVSTGSLAASIVCPRETFKAAILANTAAIICAHNHPSGDPTPSPEDLATTKRLMDAGELLGIPVLDHVIIGYAQYYSLKEHGQL